MKKHIKNIGFFLFVLALLHGTQLFSMQQGRSSRLFYGYTTEKPFDFFEQITGMPEEDFSKLPLKEKLKFYDEKIETWAGKYRQYSLKYLRKHENDHGPFTSYGCFEIMPETTIQEIMGNKGFRDAVIFSASNVNTLEGGMGKKNSLLIEMSNHAVQGETVKTCAPFCDIENKYFPRYKKFGKGQPINLLNAIKGFKVSKTGKINSIPKKLTETDYENICIGYRNSVRPYYGADREHSYKHANGLVTPMLKKIELDYEGQLPWNLDIAMAFAIDLNHHHIGKWQYNVYDEDVRNVAKKITNAMYELGIKAAFHNGKQKFVITLLGAGAFQNPTKWPIEGIRKIKDFAVKKNMEIYLVIPTKKYSPEIDRLKKEFDEAFAIQKKLRPAKY